ncbi:dual specificity protein phosphatase family protein [Neobacillus sp. GCM10023253]|uniref:protein-tyrosine phosphatase family protein n=1 Tax=Neobacillus sp. GCM10023253 TaxID=3252644 RepID=UPI00361D1718
MNHIEMIPGRLYAGGSISSDDWNFVKRKISAIVNLRITPDQPEFDFSRRVMIWSPIFLWVKPSVEWLDNLMKQINKLVDRGHRVLIHCRFGIHRTGFILTAFYMYRYRLDREQALRKVRRKKPDVAPPPIYMEVLSKYEKFLGIK